MLGAVAGFLSILIARLERVADKSAGAALGRRRCGRCMETMDLE